MEYIFNICIQETEIVYRLSQLNWAETAKSKGSGEVTELRLLLRDIANLRDPD